MSLKSGVRIKGITPELVYAAGVVQRILGAVDCVITSALDGEHSPNSKHYIGDAIDIRTRDLTPEARQGFRDKVAAALGPEFDVVLEATHLHIELDVKDAPAEPGDMA